MNGPNPQKPDLTTRIQALVSKLQRGSLDRADRAQTLESVKAELSSVSAELHSRAAGDPMMGALLALVVALLPEDSGAGEGGGFADPEE